MVMQAFGSNFFLWALWACSQATITTGRQLPDSDPKALTDYYSLTSCINTLRKMNYESNIYSSHVLRQTLARLSDKLLMRWSEYSLRIRRKEEPNLIHLEEWLQNRVMASKYPYLPQENLPLYIQAVGRKLQPGHVHAVNKTIFCSNVNHTRKKPIIKGSLLSNNTDSALTLLTTTTRPKVCNVSPRFFLTFNIYLLDTFWKNFRKFPFLLF